MNGRQILISPSPSTSWQDQNAEVQLVQYNPIKIRSERPNLRLEFEQSKDNYLFVNTQFSSLHSSCQPTFTLISTFDQPSTYSKDWKEDRSKHPSQNYTFTSSASFIRRCITSLDLIRNHLHLFIRSIHQLCDQEFIIRTAKDLHGLCRHVGTV